MGVSHNPHVLLRRPGCGRHGAHGDPRALRPRDGRRGGGTVEPPAPRPRQIMVRAWWRAGDRMVPVCVAYSKTQSTSKQYSSVPPRAKVNDLNARRRTVNSQPSRRRPKSPKREGGRSPPSVMTDRSPPLWPFPRHIEPLHQPGVQLQISLHRPQSSDASRGSGL